MENYATGTANGRCKPKGGQFMCHDNARESWDRGSTSHRGTPPPRDFKLDAKDIVALSGTEYRRTTGRENRHWLHVDRAARGHRYHRDPRIIAFACPGPSQGESQADLLHEQHETDWHCRRDVCRRLESIPWLSLHSGWRVGKLLLCVADSVIQPYGGQSQGVHLPCSRALDGVGYESEC